MYIENPEALKAWLSNILKPLCEADPSALAKYVLALAKKDKTEQELRASMISQLDVFLQKETIHFVDTLFIALETKSYIPPVLGTETIVPENAQDPEFMPGIQTSPHVGYIIDGPVGRPEAHIKRSESDREDGRRGRKRTRSRGSSRSSSRSRSPRDKFRRSRSISNDRAKIGRPSRSRRSPRRTVYRRRTPVYRRSRSASRRSPARRSRSPLRVRARTRSPDRRREEKPVTGAVIPLPLDLTIPPPPLPPGKQRCRDFDEKGFCMLGELCPFDHGTDPVVVDDTELPRVLNFSGNLPEVLPPLHVSHVVPPPPTVAVEPYNPDVPAISWPRPGYPPLMAPLPYQPTMRPTGHRPYIRRNMTTPVQAVVPAGQFVREIRPIKVDPETDESMGTVMAEARQRRIGARNPNNCCLELRKVPRGLNNIAQLNQHFSKFGRIVNLQIMYGGDPEAAVVTFSNHGEALAAYRSSEAVMNNRFIKVFWHNADKQENIPPSIGSIQRSLKDRLGPVPHDQEMMDYEEDKIQSTTFVNKEVLAKQQEHQKAQELESIKQAQALLAAQEAMRKKQEQKKKEAAKLQLDIVKRKQDLLEKQIEQQKILLAKLEKGGKTMKKDERDTLVKTIKTVQESIESLKREISAPLKRNLEDIQKELFQAEVELQSRLMAPAEYAVAKQRLVGLRQELAAAGGATVRGKPVIRARGGRGGFIGPKISLDRRTTKLCVSGFKEEDTGDVLALLAQYGDIVSHTSAEPTDLIVEYKYRYEAETALKEIVNQEFLDRKLRAKWHPSPPALKEQVPVSNTVKEPRSEKLMDLTEPLNDELLDYDNEEMEELSWKR